MRFALNMLDWIPGHWLLLVGLIFASVNPASAQGCEIVFTLESLPAGPVTLFPGLDQPAPEFNSNGIVLSFGPYSLSPGAPATMNAAAIGDAPAEIDSPQALFLTETNALFDLSSAAQTLGGAISSVSIQLQGDGSGASINLGVNGYNVFVGSAAQIPQTLQDGITTQVTPGNGPTAATLTLSGNVQTLELGGNIALGNLCVSGGNSGGGNTPGCTDTEAVNWDPNANLDDGSCLFPVVLSVDVSQPDSPNMPIYIAGTFNGWDAVANPLSNEVDEIWSTTLFLPNGQIEYKFTTAGWGNAEQFNGGESCTLTTGDFVNRLLTVDGATTVPTVCWNSCDPCPTPCTDADQDGICDDQDPCVGAFDQCGVCNGNDDCLGNDIAGCTQVNACNYNPDATVEDGSCNFDSSHLFAMTVNLDQYPEETSWVLVDALSDTVLAGGPYESGTDNFATHLVSTSLCAGCYTLTVADQFGDGMCCQFGNGSYALTIDDQTVASGAEYGLTETTEVCTPGFSAAGCTYETALNYNPAATEDDGSCLFDTNNCDADADGDGICDDQDPCIGVIDDCGECNGQNLCIVPGCTYANACNYNAAATTDDGSCTYDCFGCTDATACNYNAAATSDDGSCILPAPGLDCTGNCLEDADGDGICDDQDPCIGVIDDCGECNGQNLCIVPGCTYANACNFNPAATSDDGSCQAPDDCGVCGGNGATLPCGCTDIPAGDCDCEGNQLDAIGVCGGPCTADANADGICDDQQGGCTYPDALNYNADAAVDDGSCQYDSCAEAIPGCTVPESDNYNPDATIDDGSCGTLCADANANGICDNVEIDDPGDGCCLEEDECGECNGPGPIYACGCSEMPPGDCDCDGNQLDALGVCGGDCQSDLDGDGICDSDDECVGFPDACGICNGPGPIYDCGCEDLDANTCDCQGNQLDALGICGGNCAADLDGDGICDTNDDCVGEVDICGVCNGPGPIGACGCFDLPAGACDCLGNQLDALGVCGGNCTSDVDGNGICDNLEITGCSDPTACNYIPNATQEGPCTYADTTSTVIVIGCLDPIACNFSEQATEGDSTLCTYPIPPFDCDGTPLADLDGDGIPDLFEVGGCTHCDACNFDPDATDDDGSCTFPAQGTCDCDGTLPDALGVCGGDCLGDDDGDGICNHLEIAGCPDPAACNYQPNVSDTLDCIYADISTDTVIVTLTDTVTITLTDTVTDTVTVTQTLACLDPEACNYQPAADLGDPLMCVYATAPFDCAGQCIHDSDGDGICDENEIVGCPDPAACNFSDLPLITDVDCTYPDPGFDCDGQCLDDDGDGICNDNEIPGCTYDAASNFNENATEDNGTCDFPPGGPSSGCPDIDGDGTVAIGDLLTLLGSFGEQVDC